MKRYGLRHQLFPLMVVIVSALLFYLLPSWIFGLTFIVLTGISCWISYWITLMGKIQAEEDYWMYVAQSIQELKHSDPTIWEAMGLIAPPSITRLEVDKTNRTQTPHDDNTFYSVTYTDISIPPALLEVFANGIISGSHTLSEGQWCGEGKPFGSTRFRKFQDQMLKHKLIVAINPDAPTQGYMVTELGIQWLLQYASEGVRATYLTRVVKQTPV